VFFSFSAKTVTGLGTAQLTQASVLLHPSYITVDDVRGMYEFSHPTLKATMIDLGCGDL